MANGDELNDLLEYKQHINNLSPDQRAIFALEQMYELKTEIGTVKKEVGTIRDKVETCLPSGSTSKKAATGISMVVTAAILAAWESIKPHIFGGA
jgi:hypothetical protein